MGCKSCTISKHGGGNNINKREQDVKDVESLESVTKSTSRGGFWKRIISKKD